MPYTELARAESPRGEVVLRERTDEDAAGPPVLELRVNGVFVMDSLETTTEQALATAALNHVAQPRDVVVAGLGLGFTVRAVLTDQRVERVAVVEVEEALVGWMRDGTVPHGPSFLADERVALVVADVRQAMAEAAPSTYDLVLLDVDNGPGYLVRGENAEVYEEPFLRSVHAVLRPGGAVAVWSAAQAPGLRERLAAVFVEAAGIPLDVALQGRAEHYWLYLARR